MKVGDKVKVVNTRALHVNLVLGAEGVIEEYQEGGFDPYKVRFPNIYPIQHCTKSNLELIPQTQELTLEDVFTVAPQKVLNGAVRTQVKELGIPFSDFLNDDHTHFHFYKGVLEAGTHNGWSKQEVSIPQFLTLLEEYSARKKEVKVQLNDLLEAVVDTEKGMVSVYYVSNDEANPFTFQQLLDFQQALKGGEHSFKEIVRTPTWSLGMMGISGLPTVLPERPNSLLTNSLKSVPKVTPHFPNWVGTKSPKHWKATSKWVARPLNWRDWRP